MYEKSQKSWKIVKPITLREKLFLQKLLEME